MGWTQPRKIARGNEWFDDSFDYEGPACYELVRHRTAADNEG